MIFIEFYENEPLVILTKMTAEEYAENEAGDIRTFESLEVFSEQYPSFKIPAPRKDKMPQLRREAIRRAADLYTELQAIVVGTSDKSRETGFKLNAEASRSYLAGTATAAQEYMLQMQLDTNNANNHPVIAGMTLPEFSAWVSGLGDIGYIGSGIIESAYLTCVTQINEATDRAALDAALNTMDADFYQKLNAAMSS